ncbi:MAG TPA: alpha/beta hydrolase [Thermoplasmata archaeon]|nr:alpha/beta hydrolase [Thermoplasmata archaeon]
MPTAKLRTATLDYAVVGGEGDPTVLVHGPFADRRLWDRVASPLARALQVVSYDRRGYGGSRGPARTHPVRDDAADLAGLLGSLDLFPAHVIGDSYGAVVALRMALDRPEMVRSVVAHDVPFLGLLDADPVAQPGAAAWAERARGFGARIRAGERDPVAREVFDTEYGDLAAWEALDPGRQTEFAAYAARWVEELDDPETTRPSRAELEGLDIPILLTSGDNGPAWARPVDAQLSAMFRNAATLSVPGAGHWPWVTRPDAFVGLLATFLLERDVPST